MWDSEQCRVCTYFFAIFENSSEIILCDSAIASFPQDPAMCYKQNHPRPFFFTRTLHQFANLGSRNLNHATNEQPVSLGGSTSHGDAASRMKSWRSDEFFSWGWNLGRVGRTHVPYFGVVHTSPMVTKLWMLVISQSVGQYVHFLCPTNHQRILATSEPLLFMMTLWHDISCGTPCLWTVIH